MWSRRGSLGANRCAETVRTTAGVYQADLSGGAVVCRATWRRGGAIETRRAHRSAFCGLKAGSVSTTTRTGWERPAAHASGLAADGGGGCGVYRYTNFRRPDVRLLIRAARRGWCVGGAAWRRLRGSHIAEAPRAAVAARRGRRERKRRRRAERLQRRRLPAASGSCAQLTAGAAGVVCVALPDTLRVRLPRGLLRWQRPRAVGPHPASQDRSPHGRAGKRRGRAR